MRFREVAYSDGVEKMLQSLRSGVLLALTRGGRSGRDVQKLQGVPTSAGRRVRAPVLDQCSVVFECRVVRKTGITPDSIATEVVRGAYPGGDYHRLCCGQILATYVR